MVIRPTALGGVNISKVALKETIGAEQVGGICLTGPTPKFVLVDILYYPLVGIVVVDRPGQGSA